MDSKRFRKYLLRLASVAIGISLMAYLYFSTDGEFTQFIKSMNLQTMLILIAVYAGILIIDISRLIVILHPSKKSVNPTSVRATILAPSLNMLLPGRAGDLNALVGSRASDWPIGQRTRNLVLLRLMDLVVLAIIGTILAASLLNYTLMLAMILAVIIGSMVVYKILPFLVGKFASVLKLPIGEFKPEEDQIALKRFALTGISSVLFWVIQGWFTYLVINSFTVDMLSFTTVLAAVAAANLSKLIPITPGGVGIYENTLAFTLTYLGGISVEIAAAAALADGVLRYVLTASMPWLGLAFSNSPKSEEEE